jgi:hypothetical protein
MDDLGIPVLVAVLTPVSLATSPSVALAATASAYEAGAFSAARLTVDLASLAGKQTPPCRGIYLWERRPPALS